VTYFSRVTLNASHSNTQQLANDFCANNYQQHQHLWQLFAKDPDAKRDFIFRNERGKCYYMVSQRKPQNNRGYWQVETKNYSPTIKTGQTLAFSLRVNPVVSRKNKNGKSCRHDVVMDEKQQMNYQSMPISERPPLSAIVHKAGLQWLQTRAEKHGFNIDSNTVQVNGYESHTAYKKKNTNDIQYSTMDFNGLLTVVDAGQFIEALLVGIGPAKAFGCGLMLVKRV